MEKGWMGMLDDEFKDIKMDSPKLVSSIFGKIQLCGMFSHRLLLFYRNKCGGIGDISPAKNVFQTQEDLV
jgi:hypothetical protein